MKTESKILVVTMMALCVICLPVKAQFDAILNLGGSDEPAAKQIAHFKIKGQLLETPVNMPPLFGSDIPPSLKSVLSRLKTARLDENVVAIVLDIQQAALGLAQLEEIHQSLQKFAAVDKPVFVHADSLSTRSYALATGASHISLVPTGDLWLLGIYGETPYFRGTLDKIGCYPDFEHCGDFKTGAESITHTRPSEQSQEMTAWLLDSLYDHMVEIIAKGRNWSPEKVKKIIDNGPYSAEDALKLGLIDSVKHRQDYIEDLKKQFGKNIEVVAEYGAEDDMDIPDDNIFAMFEFMMKLFNPTPKVFTEPSVAIVYVEGTIVTGEAEQSPFGSSSGAHSTTIRKALDKARKDDTVKAVVLRINSPGGSALASEIILDATMRLAEKKPLIVSMGNVAGSGGYYVTCGSDMIFADRTTITASIGVLGGKIVTTDMWESLGIHWHGIQRGKMAAMMSSANTFSDKERDKFKHYMNTVYDIFKRHVVAARGDKLSKPIDQLAGGRVFSGAQALELGLIDKIGGLEDAIKYAAKRAKIRDFEIRVIPEPPSIFDIFGPSKEEEYTSRMSGSSLGLANLPMFRTALPLLSRLDPLRCQALLQTLQRVELIHDEGVVIMMPSELIIRD